MEQKKSIEVHTMQKADAITKTMIEAIGKRYVGDSSHLITSRRMKTIEDISKETKTGLTGTIREKEDKTGKQISS